MHRRSVPEIRDKYMISKHMWDATVVDIMLQLVHNHLWPSRKNGDRDRVIYNSQKKLLAGIEDPYKDVSSKVSGQTLRSCSWNVMPFDSSETSLVDA